MRKEYYITDPELEPDAKPQFVIVRQDMVGELKRLDIAQFLGGFKYAGVRKVERMFGKYHVKKARADMDALDLTWIAWDSDGRVEIESTGGLAHGYSSSANYK